MTHSINGHTVKFSARGQIIVDGRLIALGVTAVNGGHYTYKRDDMDDASAALAGRKLTGPGRPIGSYEQHLAAEIVATMFGA